MDFQHSSEIWRDFPELVPGVVFAQGITPDAAAGDRVAKFTDIARSRLEREPESELPEIRAWRRAFTRMGLKPTQYRCASEALLRRFRKEGTLPQLHPLVDVCNAVSLAFAIPVAVFDVAKISHGLEVRYAGVEDPDTRAHGPNEGLHLPEFERAVLAEALLLQRLGRTSPEGVSRS
jgi:DNA/RNA-binding domain of Phe-tRNA-synthetase-like protein